LSDAFTKNKDAIKTVTGNEELASRLQSTRIGIWSEEKSNKNSGVLLAEALGEFLGRFWVNMDATGPLSQVFLKTSNAAADSGNIPHTYRESWEPPYDYIISIGTTLPANCDHGIAIGATNWQITSGINSVFDDNKNPVGPLAAASLASSEVFKFIFKDALSEKIAEMPSNYGWLTWYGGTTAIPTNLKLYLEDVHIFGIGAVTHGLLWILERWPEEVTGTIHLVDHDKYDESNAQRYIGMRRSDVDQSKSLHSALRLQQRHPNLRVTGYVMDMNTYFRELKPDCKIKIAIAGLDSIEHRKHLALKIPKKIVNMWTEGDSLGASRFGFEKNWPCVFCVHTENISPVPDETALIHQQLGLHPSRVRELLYSSAPITEEDASQIAKKIPIEITSMTGKSLRSILGQACMKGTMSIPSTTSDANVTFVFASGLAGVGGFIELLREVNDIESQPGFWQTSVLRYPTEYSWKSRNRIEKCYLCSDEAIPKIITAKYGKFDA